LKDETVCQAIVKLSEEGKCTIFYKQYGNYVRRGYNLQARLKSSYTLCRISWNIFACNKKVKGQFPK